MKYKIPIIHFDVYAVIIVFSVLFLLIGYIPGVPFAKFTDDIVGIIYGLVILLALIKHKHINNEIKKVFILIVIISTIGLVSNFFIQLDRTIYDVVGDLFAFWKIFLVYVGLGVIIYRNPQRTKKVICLLGIVSKFFIVFSFLFGVLNLLGVVDMYSTVRYGIKNYSFYFGNPSQFGVFVGSLLAFLVFSGNKKKIYEYMAIAVLFMTAKGMAIIIAATYITLMIISNHKKIKLWQIVLVGVVLIFALQFQIQGYLLDESAPRAMLIRYGIKTAKEYFPLGSGFGTYGSNQAAVNYSPLYVKYGFLERRALAGFLDNGTTFLNDVYLGMIVGQFGFGGLILFGCVIFCIGKRIFFIKTEDERSKYITIACFLCLCGMFVMAGSVKAQPGVMLVIVLSFYNNAIGSGTYTKVV